MKRKKFDTEIFHLSLKKIIPKNVLVDAGITLL